MAKTSAAQQRAVHKYVKNNYDRLELSVPKGEKVTIQQAAKQAGQSVNAYMKKIEKFLREQKPELLHHQKFLENGTAERAKESGTEQNYNMIDGCVNNNPKKPRIIGNRISVLDRLHIKLEERKQKSQPHQQQQQERSRKS